MPQVRSEAGTQDDPHSDDGALHVRVTVPMLRAVDAYAGRCGAPRSSAVRELLCFALRNHELWPPPPAAPTKQTA